MTDLAKSPSNRESESVQSSKSFGPSAGSSGSPSAPISAGVIVLAALFFLLLAILLMVGVPFLNVRLLGGAAQAASLANWQFTANITMVGMLVTGVFVITALRMEQSARYIASKETSKVLREGKKELKAEFDQGLKESKNRLAVGNKRQLKKSKSQYGALKRKINKAIDCESSNDLSKMSEEEIREKVRNALRQMADDEVNTRVMVEALYQYIAENPDRRVADSLADRVVQSSAQKISEETTKKMLGQARWLGRFLLRAPRKAKPQAQQSAGRDPSKSGGERDGQGRGSDESSDK